MNGCFQSLALLVRNARRINSSDLKKFNVNLKVFFRHGKFQRQINQSAATGIQDHKSVSHVAMWAGILKWFLRVETTCNFLTKNTVITSRDAYARRWFSKVADCISPWFISLGSCISLVYFVYFHFCRRICSLALKSCKHFALLWSEPHSGRDQTASFTSANAHGLADFDTLLLSVLTLHRIYCNLVAETVRPWKEIVKVWLFFSGFVQDGSGETYHIKPSLSDSTAIVVTRESDAIPVEKFCGR